MFFDVLLQLLYCYSSAYQKTGFVLTLCKTHVLLKGRRFATHRFLKNFKQ